MKKTLLTLALASTTMLSFAQSTSETVTEASTDAQRSNEIMLSPIELIAVPMLNISYERLLNKNSGIGLNAIVTLGQTSEDNGNSRTLQFSPYYRMYFGKKYATGFFVEGFVPITHTSKTIEPNSSGYYFFGKPGTYKKTTIGAGVGFGGKWIVRNNILFEASMGIARRFGVNRNDETSIITGIIMLGIGYRF